MAGATRIGPGRYMLIATTSAVAWALAWMSAGYALGHVTGRMPTAFGFLTTLGFLAGAILAASGGMSGGEAPAARPRNGRPPRWASSAVTPSGPLSGYGFQNILLATSQ